MRVLKVIPAYPYVEKRHVIHGSPTKYEDWVECITRMVAGERNVDPGVDMDVVVYRMFENGKGKDMKLGSDIIDPLDKTEIASGFMYCIERENTVPTGFNILLDAVGRCHNDYDYIIFQEDDISIVETASGYVKDAIDQLEKSNIKGCIAFSPIKVVPHLHFGGFFGLIPMEQLYNIIEKFPAQSKIKTELAVNSWYVSENKLTREDINNLDGYANFPINSSKLPHFYEPLITIETKGKGLYYLGK